MNQVYLAEFIQFLCLIPAAAICFLPVKNQLKYSAKTTAVSLQEESHRFLWQVFFRPYRWA